MISSRQHPVGQLIHTTVGAIRVDTEHGVWLVPPEHALWVRSLVTHSLRMLGRVKMRTVDLAPSIAPASDARCCVAKMSDALRDALFRAVDSVQPDAEDGPGESLATVVVREFEAAPPPPLHLSMPLDARARHVADRLRERPSDKRKVGEWATESGASERTLERLFNKEVGMSFGAWRQQARLLHGLELLAAGDSVTTAAREVGFETSSAFIAMFRRAMGTTPGRYVEQP